MMNKELIIEQLTDNRIKEIIFENHSYTDLYGNDQNELLIEIVLYNNFQLCETPVSNYISSDSITCFYKGFFLMIEKKDRIKLRAPIYKGELKRFYENTSDYYYLPEEDTCIHKSVAASVDKAHRINAKKETCYTKHSGFFLRVFNKNYSIIFKEKYNSRNLYTTFSEKTLTQDFILSYSRELINHLPDYGF